MKKIILIFSIFLISLQAYGFEDCIILSDVKINSVYSKDENIAVVKPFFTIDNSKETIILKVKSEGNTKIILETDNNDIEIDVNITDETTNLTPIEGITFFPIDFVSEPKKPILRGK